jgi:hypothetical protein
MHKAMSWHLIEELTDSPQGFPLERLVDLVRQESRADTLLVVRSQGYGPTVYAWECRLDTHSEIEIAWADLAAIVHGTDEWFYELDAHCFASQGEVIRFGVFDSSFLFVEAKTQIAEKMVRHFKSTRVVAPPMR